MEEYLTNALVLVATMQRSMGLTDYNRDTDHAEMHLSRYEVIEDSLEELRTLIYKMKGETP